MTVIVRSTDEKSRSDSAELVDMQRTLRAVMDRIGNVLAFCFQNVSVSTASPDLTFRALYYASSDSLAAY